MLLNKRNQTKLNQTIIIIKTIHLKIGTRTGGHGNKRSRREHPNYSIVEIGQNIERSPGYLRTRAVTQTSVENHLLTLVERTLKWVKKSTFSSSSSTSSSSSELLARCPLTLTRYSFPYRPSFQAGPRKCIQCLSRVVDVHCCVYE